VLHPAEVSVHTEGLACLTNETDERFSPITHIMVFSLKHKACFVLQQLKNMQDKYIIVVGLKT
jgi:hypothetical protein